MIASKDKKYKDKLGRKVIIYAVYPDQQPADAVHGAIEVCDMWNLRSWKINGQFGHEPSENDLIEIEGEE